MLNKLSVKNFALIRELELEFAPGLNLITGETGAGKSLLLSALSALLGAKLTADVVRKGADKAVIEGEFRLNPDSPVKILLDDALDDQSEFAIIRREINRSGRSRAFINDSPAPLKKLAEIGELMVDLCGQHENQTLLNTERHLDYLDRYAGLLQPRDEFSQLHSRYRALNSKIQRLDEKRRNLTARQERIEFEIKEIETAALSPEEEESLRAEERAFENSEKILEFCRRFEEEISAKPGCAVEIVAGLSRELESIVNLEPRLGKTAEDVRSAQVALEEAVRGVAACQSGFDFSPERLEQIRERLGELSRLKRKYGGSVAAVIEHLIKLKSESASFTDIEEEIVAANKEISDIKPKLADKAAILSQQRHTAAPELKKEVEGVLRELGFEYVDFELRLQKKSGGDIQIGGQRFSLDSEGIDSCEFFVTANKGEPPRPLKDVASGGEISRIMLAMKSVIADGQNSGILVFDEIDIGISGRIARKVGLSLLKTAQTRQVLVITHLPQIASLPGKHFSAEKSAEDERTVSRFLILDQSGRIREIAKLLAAGDDPEKGEDYARQLMSSSGDEIL